MSTENLPRDDIALALGSDYDIVRELGRGGASVVYLGRDRVLGREVAIKVIRDSQVGDPEAIARFQREARMLASLQHPNIVMLYSAKQLPGGALALVMQHGKWATLKSIIREQGPLPVEAIEQVLTDVASALVYLHRHDVIHRDIKPENIFIEAGTGRALLSDFGIAKSGDSGTSVTLTGVVIGTPAYMSPEQIDGGALTGRSDLYSLGMVGYEMLTGLRPWEGESLFSVIYKQKTEQLRSILERRPDAPEHLRTLIDRATQKDPTHRWRDAAEFLGAIGAPIGSASKQPWADGVAPGAAPELEPTEYPTLEIDRALMGKAFAHTNRRRPRGKRRLLAAAVVLLLFGGGAGALAFSGRIPTEIVLGSRAEPREDSTSTGNLALALRPGATAPTEEVDTSRFRAGETVADSAQPTAVSGAKADSAVEEVEEEVTRPERQAPPRSAADRSPPQQSRSVPELQQQAQPVRTGPPSLLPSVSVTRPTGSTPSEGGSRQLQSLDGGAGSSAPQLENRESVGQLLADSYPTDLRTSGVGGTTVLTVLVSPNGTVERSSVATSSGNHRLDQAAQSVASRMVFRHPQGASPGAVWVAVPLTFNPQ